MNSIFEDWREGLLTDAEALHALACDLGEVESQLAPLEQERTMLRDHLSHIVDRIGGRADIPGFGRLELSAPTVVRGYDRKRLDALLVDLAADYPAVVQQLAQCRTETARAGSLRITREKGTK